MKITIELSDTERWVTDTNQPEMASMKDEIEKHANAIIKPLNDILIDTLDSGTFKCTIEQR